jgi:hypothetical protein
MNSLLVVVGLLAASAVAQDKDLPELPLDFSLAIGKNLSLLLHLHLLPPISTHLSFLHNSPKERKFSVFFPFLFLFFG